MAAQERPSRAARESVAAAWASMLEAKYPGTTWSVDIDAEPDDKAEKREEDG
jgi:hypothetical protein